MAINKLIIFFGQSNCRGAEPMATLPVERQGLKLNLRIWDGTKFECIDSTTNNNQLIEKLNEYSYEFWLEDLSPDLNQDIYVLKYGIGGARLANSAPTWNVAGALWAALQTEIDDIEAWMTARGKEFEWHSVIWHQGESDSGISLAFANQYEGNETALISAIDTKLGTTPFFYNVGINPDLNREWDSIVDAAKHTTTSNDTTTRRYVSQTGVSLQGDNTHLNAAGTETLGNLIVNTIKSDL